MVEKLGLLRDLLHKTADFVTDFLELCEKFKNIFKGGEVKEDEIEISKEDSE